MIKRFNLVEFIVIGSVVFILSSLLYGAYLEAKSAYIRNNNLNVPERKQTRTYTIITSDKTYENVTYYSTTGNVLKMYFDNNEVIIIDVNQEIRIK